MQVQPTTVGLGITSVIIPNTVKIIGEGAFAYNKLISIIIPNSVTSIGVAAFYKNNLTSVTIPNSVTSIGKGAFNSNQLSDKDAFIYKRNSDGGIDNTTIVSYGGKNIHPIIPDTVTSIGIRAFASNKLTSVTIPNSVTSVGEGAFYNNKLTNSAITFPTTPLTIDCRAFDNNLEDIIYPSNVTDVCKYK